MTAPSAAPPDTTAVSRHRRSAPVPPYRAALALGLLCVLATVALALVVHAHPERPPFQALDDRWLRWMGGPRNGVCAALAAVLNWFGGPLGVVVPGALLVFLAARKRWWSLLFLLTSYLVGNMLVVQVLKHLVDRPRPPHPLVRVDHGSFPSGHAAGTALLVVVVGALLVPAARRPMWWLGGTLFTLAMMWSRTWLHAHWLSDTLAGAMAGAGCGLLLWRAFAPLLLRERSPANRDTGVQEP
jgi:membrane-associated phospholipid phosphatase